MFFAFHVDPLEVVEACIGLVTLLKELYMILETLGLGGHELNIDDAEDVLACIRTLPDEVRNRVGMYVFWSNVVSAIEADVMAEIARRLGRALTLAGRHFWSSRKSVEMESDW